MNRDQPGRAAMRRMVIIVVCCTGYGQVTHVPGAAWPLVPQLLDEVRYMKPSGVPPLEGTELRRYRHRGPTLRSLVKPAVVCDSAEQLGHQLKRRYARQRQRQGIARAGCDRAEAELADSGLSTLTWINIACRLSALVAAPTSRKVQCVF